MSGKLKFAFYWAASCGGCDVAVLDINEKILDVAELADIYLWPVALDFKYKDIEALEDGFLDVSFFNGAVRNSEQKEIAHLLRKKSKVMVAFGSCACFGGIPGLANLYSKEEILSTVYAETPSTVNPEKVIPRPRFSVQEGELTIPEFFTAVYKLADFVNVDYSLPGCPPPVSLIIKAVEAIAGGNLPPVGTVIAGEKTVCDTCKKKKDEKRVVEFKRPHEIIPDPEKCLLEQGIVCCGPGTRGGCGGRCMEANMPCRGCFGPNAGVPDQGAKIASAIASTVVSKSEEEMKRLAAQVADPAGTFYRFSLPDSLLRGKALRRVE
ncbi:MAG: oxidoreductase [Bacillota bacterium]